MIVTILMRIEVYRFEPSTVFFIRSVSTLRLQPTPTNLKKACIDKLLTAILVNMLIIQIVLIIEFQMRDVSLMLVALAKENVLISRSIV